MEKLRDTLQDICSLLAEEEVKVNVIGNKYVIFEIITQTERGKARIIGKKGSTIRALRLIFKKLLKANKVKGTLAI